MKRLNHLKWRRNRYMSNRILQYIEEGKKTMEQLISDTFDSHSIPKKLYHSMTYSLFAGGKRLRPILLFASYETFNNNVKKVHKTAVALEMIHTYSLIHDDLPAMDDDNFRRGKLTNHKKFDEATAILAGDALLTKSFEIIASDDYLTNEEKVFIIQLLANSSGPRGMVGGQILDMEGENAPLNLEQLEKVHELKTGKLIKFAIIAGAYLANADKETIQYLKKFAHYLGLIFQVQDDILDIEGDPEKLGKPIGSDVGNQKSTYPNLLGLDGAKQQKEIYVKKANNALTSANAHDSLLMDLLHYFSNREF